MMNKGELICLKDQPVETDYKGSRFCFFYSTCLHFTSLRVKIAKSGMDHVRYKNVLNFLDIYLFQVRLN